MQRCCASEAWVFTQARAVKVLKHKMPRVAPLAGALHTDTVGAIIPCRTDVAVYVCTEKADRRYTRYKILPCDANYSARHPETRRDGRLT